MGVTTAPSAPTQRQRRPRPTRPRTDEELAESRIYNGLSHHDGDGQVALVWRSGEWAVWRRGERLRALVEEELDVFAFLEVLCLMDCTIEETASNGRRRMTFQRE